MRDTALDALRLYFLDWSLLLHKGKPTNSEKEINVRQIEFTWWAEDGSERRGRVSIAPDASPETVAALARMMRLADPAGSRASGKVKAPFWLEDSPDTFDGPPEERC